jgi:hypothetical protein
MKQLFTLSLIWLSLYLGAQTNVAATKQFNKSITFDISIETGALFDVANKEWESSGLGMGNTTTGPVTGGCVSGASLSPVARRYNLNGQNFGGIDVEMGLAIKKQYHINAVTGFSANRFMAWIPAGVDFKYNILKTRISPFVHAGGGYMYRYMSNLNTMPYDVFKADNGAFAMAGIGVYARITNMLALSLAPEYRFMFNNYQYDYNGVVTEGSASTTTLVSIKRYIHQVGFKLAVMFY